MNVKIWLDQGLTLCKNKIQQTQFVYVLNLLFMYTIWFSIDKKNYLVMTKSILFLIDFI